jgi:hypothetical protein
MQRAKSARGKNEKNAEKNAEAGKPLAEIYFREELDLKSVA